MNKFEKTLNIFVVPYICTSIFLLVFLITRTRDHLYFSLTSFIYTSVCLLLSKQFLYYYSKQGFGLCPFFSSAIKTLKLVCIIYLFLCAAIFLINLFTGIIDTFSMILYIFALFYSVFPQTFLIFTYLLFHRNISELKKEKIKLINPDIIEDIKKSSILIIDDFDKFGSLELIESLASRKHIVLVAKDSQSKIISKHKTIIHNLKFYNADSNETPDFSADCISVYCNTNIYEVTKLIKHFNKSYIVVCENELSDLCCKISATNSTNSDILIPERDIRHIETILQLNNAMFSNFKKCIVYTLTINIAKFLCVLCCIFICSHMPLSPLMLVLTSIICDFIPPLSFIYDKHEKEFKSYPVREIFTQILLDSCLLGIVSFIVYMAGAIIFSHKCSDIICFNVFIFSSLLYTFNLRHDKSVFFIGILTNKITNFSFFAGISASVIASCLIYSDISDLGVYGWLLIIAMSVIPFAVTQLQKAAYSVFYK